MSELMIALSAVATMGWKVGGVFLSRNMAEENSFHRFCSCITYALVAALTLQMTLHPQSSLAHSESWERLAALGATLLAYRLSRSSVAAGTLTGLVVFATLLNI